MASSGSPTQTAAELVRASELEPRQVEWLWHARIPFQALTFLVGEPGLGKSLLTVKLAAELSQGLLTGEGEASLLLTAEDSLEHTVLPRLTAAGADLERVFFLRAEEIGGAVQLPSDLELVASHMDRAGARLLVIDPFVAHLPAKVNSWQDHAVRGALAPLHTLASETGSAIVLVGHLNKRQGANPLERVGGSIGIPAAARSVLLLARDPADPDGETGNQRVLAHIKSNVGPLAGSLAFTLEEAVLDGDVEITTARLVEEGFSAFTGTDLLVADGVPSDGKLAEAIAILEEQLSDGPRPVAELKALAKTRNISATTLQRAKAQLGVKSKKLALDQGWAWYLPSSDNDLSTPGNSNLIATPSRQRKQAPF